jgi:peptidoglycan/LPS O-acetylase OafA/YrhL
MRTLQSTLDSARGFPIQLIHEARRLSQCVAPEALRLVSSLPYYKSLDGIRGIAVLMVIFIHSRLLPFGWVGVQIFFVLSGFLITSILLSQTDRPFSTFIGRFYWRRGLRIWPLYFLFLLLCAIGYACVKRPETWPSSWPWLVTFTYNLGKLSPRFVDSDYFGHFWTLCIEEQFYLVWPLAVFFLPLKGFRRFVLLVVLAGPVIRYFTGVVFFNYFGSLQGVRLAVHHLPTSHLDAFAAGALLAVLPANLRERLAPKAKHIFFAILAVTATAGLLQSWCLWRHGLPPHWLAFGYDNLQNFRQYIWAYSLLNLTAVCLIFCAIESPSISKFLSLRPLVFIGMISYGAYVWQLPLLHIFSIIWPANPHGISGLGRFVIYFFTTLTVAAFSYFCFERYFLNMKKISFGAAKPLAPSPITAPESGGS